MLFFYILVLAAPMPNHPLFEASVLGMSIIKWLGIASCVYAVAQLPSRVKYFGSSLSAETGAFAVLVGIAAVSYATLSRPETITFKPMSSYVSYLLLFFIAICLVDSPEKLHRTLLVGLVGSAIAALYVIREYQASGGMQMRPGYIAGDSNYFATCSLLAIPIGFCFARRENAPIERVLCIVSTVVILVAFTLASSRGGLVGLCLEIGYMILRTGKSRRIAILLGMLLLPALLFSPVSPLGRMLHPEYGDELATQIRRDFWRVGFMLIREHPLTGIGLGNFTAYSFSASPGAAVRHGMACNTFLEIAAELGVPGFLAYCGLSGAALWSAEKLRSEGKKRKDVLRFYSGEAMQVGLLGFLGAAMFVSAEYQKPFWVIVALAAASPSLLTQSPSRSRAVKSVLVPASSRTV